MCATRDSVSLKSFFFPLEVGGSRLNSSHVPEELQKNVHIGCPSTFYSDSKLRGGGVDFKDTQSGIRIHAWWSNVNDYP